MRSRLFRRLCERRWPQTGMLLLGVGLWFILVVVGQAKFHYLG